VLRDGVVRGRPNPLHFGLDARLKKVLKQSGLTRRALARKAGVSDPLIGYLETRQRLPSVATVARLAAGLSVSAGWLAYGIGETTTEGPAATTDGMGSRLQSLRIERGLTKAALARLVMLSPSAFAKIEKGGQSGIDVIEALAKALEVSPAWLAFNQGPLVLPRTRRGRPAEHSSAPVS
jgi:transcriptional regulator with XRE-family HTH domain